MRRLGSRLTYANVTATLALFIAVGGASAFAATQLGKNSVGTKQIKNQAVTGAKIKKGTITGTNINLAKLGTVPSATNATNATTAGTASALSAPEAMHIVGQPGQPLFEGGSTNYTFAGITLPPVGFYKDKEGIVHLEGFAQVGKEVAAGTYAPVFTLPPGFRPASGVVQIFSAGGLGAALFTGTNASFEGKSFSGTILGSEKSQVLLSGITFRAQS
jgi:hypothetical protein